MSLPWKLMPLAAIVAIGAFFVLAGSNLGNTPAAFANEPQLDVSVDTNPEDGFGYVFEVEVNGNNDEGDDCEDEFDGTTATVDDDESATLITCDDSEAEITVTLTVTMPAHSELTDLECVISDEGATPGEDSTSDPPEIDEDEGSIDMDIVDEEHVSCEITADFDEDAVTPTVTVTSTVGPAATVIANASPNAVTCGGTSIITIQVRGANGQPVAVGTAVQISASIGSVSPSSGQTTDASGSAFVFFTAPATQGGTATITAEAGNAEGSATVTVNCAQATATTAPPPTVQPGTISPPNTGNAGLADNGSSWQGFAGLLALTAGLSIGAIAFARFRN